MYCGILCGSPGWQVESRFKAFLRSFFVVPPIFIRAKGKARFHYVDTTKINFRLEVFGLPDVIAATIHLGEFGQVGPVVAVLFHDVRGAEITDKVSKGIVLTGTLRDSDLRGPLAGKPISCLVQEMRHEAAYVQVSTKRHPKGALRGQIFMTETEVVEHPPLWSDSGHTRCRTC